MGPSDHLPEMPRLMWTKTAFYTLAEGFWASRVANGLTTPEDAAHRVEQQHRLIDHWYPEQETP